MHGTLKTLPKTTEICYFAPYFGKVNLGNLGRVVEVAGEKAFVIGFETSLSTS